VVKTVIIIAGPTAVGKTAIAIEIAKLFGSEIISADSRQCYKELKIGVARPSSEELKSVPHHFIASHSIHETINAGVFEQYALEKTKELFQKDDVVVMAGGTGLYIKAFCEGIDAIPEVPENIRNEIILSYEANGLGWLQEQLRNTDPHFYAVGEIQNPQRMMRALEVFQATGKSVLEFRRGKKIKRDFNILKIALELPKELLHNNINGRVEKMIESGLLEEVKALLPYQHLNALQTVGYKELFDYFNGKLSLTDSLSEIKKNTRQYAKRQLTWFKKDKEYSWFQPSQAAKIKEHLNDALSYK
jgi:tRNA dimethylallyltransferase